MKRSRYAELSFGFAGSAPRGRGARVGRGDRGGGALARPRPRPRQSRDARCHGERRGGALRHQQLPERPQRRHPRQPEPALPGPRGLRRPRLRGREGRRQRPPSPRAASCAPGRRRVRQPGHGSARTPSRPRPPRWASLRPPTCAILSAEGRPGAQDDLLVGRRLARADPGAAGLAADRERAAPRVAARHRRHLGARTCGTPPSTRRRARCSSARGLDDARPARPSSRPRSGRRSSAQQRRRRAAEPGHRRVELPRPRRAHGEPQRPRAASSSTTPPTATPRPSAGTTPTAPWGPSSRSPAATTPTRTSTRTPTTSRDFGQDVDGGAGLDFDFPADLTEHAQSYRPAVTTNLFYGCNVIHDITWRYGFDEASGNFQIQQLRARRHRRRLRALRGRGRRRDQQRELQHPAERRRHAAHADVPVAGQPVRAAERGDGGRRRLVRLDHRPASGPPRHQRRRSPGAIINAGNGCVAADYAGAPAGDWMAIVDRQQRRLPEHHQGPHRGHRGCEGHHRRRQRPRRRRAHPHRLADHGRRRPSPRRASPRPTATRSAPPSPPARHGHRAQGPRPSRRPRRRLRERDHLPRVRPRHLQPPHRRPERELPERQRAGRARAGATTSPSRS